MDNHRDLTMFIERNFEQFFDVLESELKQLLEGGASLPTSASEITSTSPKLSVCALAERKLQINRWLIVESSRRIPTFRRCHRGLLSAEASRREEDRFHCSRQVFHRDLPIETNMTITIELSYTITCVFVEKITFDVRHS